MEMSDSLRVRVTGLNRDEIEASILKEGAGNIESEINDIDKLKLSKNSPEFVLEINQSSLIDLLRKKGVMVKSCTRPD
jgi:hypothetical protein